jgi:hypothetical protein
MLATPSRWARVTRVVVLIVVVLGLAGAFDEVTRGVAAQQVEFRGTLDADVLLEQANPGQDDARRRLERLGSPHLDTAEGTYVVPNADAFQLVAWSLATLLPWFVATLALVLAQPVLREGERGDPFQPAIARRLTGAGMTLLIGLPLASVLRTGAALTADLGGASPFVTPELTLSLGHFLPGLLTLAVASILHRATERTVAARPLAGRRFTSITRSEA